MRYSFLGLSIAGLLFIGCAAGYGLWYSYVASESTTAAHLLGVLAAGETAKAESRAFSSALAALGSDQASLANYFVSQDTVVPFLEALQSLAASLGSALTVQSVNYKNDSANPTLAIALQITGSFSAVGRTVGAIEHAPYVLTTTSLALSSSVAGGWTATMTVTVGSLPQEAANTSP